MDQPVNSPQDSPPIAMTRRRVLAGFGAVAGFSSMAALIAACSSSSTSTATTTASATTVGSTAATTVAAPAVVKGGNLIVDVQTEPQGFNPLQYPNAAYAWLTRQVVDSLYWYGDDGKRAPVLADGDPVTTDGMVWTIKLKSGIKFHNGDPFTAAHVAATFGVINTAPTNAWGTRVGDLKSVVATDDSTITITLGKPNWLMPDVLAVIPMLHKDHLAEQIPILGTGAFKWGELVPGKHLRLDANANYHLGAPNLDSVTFQFVPDPNTRAVDLLSGNAHAIMIPGFDTLGKLAGTKGITVVEVPAVVMLPIHVNANSPVFKDVRVRQALGHAIDRTRVRDVAFAGKADIFQGGVIPPVLRGFNPDNKFWPVKADIAKSKQLLADAGVTGPVKFTVALYNVSNAVNAMQVIQQDWKAAGFEADIQPMDLASFAKVLLSKTFDVCVSYEFNGTNWGQVGVSTLDGYTTGNFVNFTNYADPAFDKLLVDSRAEKDQAKQSALWQQADRMLTEAAVNLIPVVPRLTMAHKDTVTGIPLGMLNLSYLRLYKASLGK
jgi:peptide/nickel transport system substrate-binding protein